VRQAQHRRHRGGKEWEGEKKNQVNFGYQEEAQPKKEILSKRNYSIREGKGGEASPSIKKVEDQTRKGKSLFHRSLVIYRSLWTDTDGGGNRGAEC